MIFNSNNYPLDKEYRNRQMVIAERRSRAAKRSVKRRYDLRPTHSIVTFTIFLLFLALILFDTNSVGATDSMKQRDADASPGAPVQLALILGDFYFDKGQYPKAVIEFTRAIELMPEILFELMPEHAVVFWQLGDAQFMAGYDEDALISYQRYLELTGDKATLLAHTFVQQLTVAIQIGNTETIQILGR